MQNIIKGAYTYANIFATDVDGKTKEQITNFCNNPVFSNRISMMPDTHYGKGVPIGFSMKLTNKVIPNVIGVDIGCGVSSINLGNAFEGFSDRDWGSFDSDMRRSIPTGYKVHKKVLPNVHNDILGRLYKRSTKAYEDFSKSYQSEFNYKYLKQEITGDYFKEICRIIEITHDKVTHSIGTLGGGNHFIEVGKDIWGDYWLTVHSGSRNFGKCVADFWQVKATNSILDKLKKDKSMDLEEVLKNETTKADRVNLIKDINSKYHYDITHLEYLEGENSFGYFRDMLVAQEYAKLNRESILSIIINNILDIKLRIDTKIIDSTHNYIDPSDLVIRKGAIRAWKGDIQVVPLNMRDGILVIKGKGNPDWNRTAPHGSGRLYGRIQAKKLLSMNTFRKQMLGIHSSSVMDSTLDEAPDAYKNSNLIEKLLYPTCDIINKIRTVYNFKSLG